MCSQTGGCLIKRACADASSFNEHHNLLLSGMRRPLVSNAGYLPMRHSNQVLTLNLDAPSAVVVFAPEYHSSAYCMHAEAASTSGRPHAQAAQQHGGVAAAGNSMGAQPQQASSRPQGPSSGATAKEQTSYPIRLTGLSPTTTRRDVARLFAGFSITEYNIK